VDRRVSSGAGVGWTAGEWVALVVVGVVDLLAVDGNRAVAEPREDTRLRRGSLKLGEAIREVVAGAVVLDVLIVAAAMRGRDKSRSEARRDQDAARERAGRADRDESQQEG